VRSGIIRLTGFIAAILLVSVACDALATPPAAPGGETAPDLEAPVRAVVSSVQSTPQPTAPPGEAIDVQATDVQATIVASVQATVEALRAATPIPSPTPADRLAPTQVTSSNALPTPSATPVTTLVPQPTATFVPTPTPEPTQISTPAPSLVASCGTPPDGTKVTAWIDGQAVAAAAVQNGAYTIFMDQGDGEQFSAKTVTFKIGSLDANESGIWVQGGASELDLTASGAEASSSKLEPTTGKLEPASGPGTAADVQPRRGGPLAQRGHPTSSSEPPLSFVSRILRRLIDPAW